MVTQKGEQTYRQRVYGFDPHTEVYFALGPSLTIVKSDKSDKSVKIVTRSSPRFSNDEELHLHWPSTEFHLALGTGEKIFVWLLPRARSYFVPHCFLGRPITIYTIVYRTLYEELGINPSGGSNCSKRENIWCLTLERSAVVVICNFN